MINASKPRNIDEETTMTYANFVEDLKDRLTEYNDSFKSDAESRYPKRQREVWAPSGRCQAITQSTFGYDHEACLRLLEECGYDGAPVSSQKANTTRRWFEDSNGHIFPPRKDVLRVGLFFCLDFYTLLHWVLKSDFEEYLVKGDERFSPGTGQSLLNIIVSYNEEPSWHNYFQDTLAAYQHQLDRESLFMLFERHWHLASTAGYNRNNFSTLIEDLFMENLLCYPNNSEKVDNFGAYQKKIIEQAQAGTREDQDALWRNRCVWQTLLDELDTTYVDIENARLKNAEVDQAYLRQFGPIIIQQTELETEIRLTDLRLFYLRKEPGITEEELDEKIRDTQQKLEREMADLKLRGAQAQGSVLVQAWSDFGVPMEPEDLDKEKEECKREIREIRKMVHPDVLMHDPVYAKLNDEQKKELEDIMLEALKIHSSELGYPPNFAYHDMRSLEGLRQVRRKVEAILKVNNIQVDLRYEIQGETIQEQIAWLNEEITLLENRLNAAKGQLAAMLADKDVKSKRRLLDDKEKRAEFEQQMEEEIKSLTIERDRLQEEISAIRAE
jgi:hypothetical protein